MFCDFGKCQQIIPSEFLLFIDLIKRNSKKRAILTKIEKHHNRGTHQDLAKIGDLDGSRKRTK